MKMFRYVLCFVFLALGSFCFGSDTERYINSNYCFTVPRLHLASETLSQDGAGITFSKVNGCAEAPVGSCEKVSVYAQYAVGNERSPTNWFEDLDSVYVQSGWNLDRRGVKQANGVKWRVSTFSKTEAGRRVSVETYQTASSKSKPAIIYAIDAVFPAEDKANMYAYIGQLTREFERTDPCR